jgi:hypothetical protein
MPETSAYQLAGELLALLAAERPELLDLPLAAIRKRLAPCRHGPGFASVLWHGTAYYFSPTQAAVVKQLWAAWRNGTPAVRQETLLLRASSDCQRLVDVFRDHPAWGSLIVPGPAKGTLRLAEPGAADPETQERP